MNDPDRIRIWPNGIDGGLPERLWGYDGFTATEEQQPIADVTGGLVSLGFIKAALKRRKWFWCTTALVGLLIGCGLYVKYPPAYQASTTVLLTNNPNEDPTEAIQTDQALAESRAVAARVVQSLGLRQSVGSLVAATTVATVTDQVITINVNAPSGEDAMLRANALATAFLQFRNKFLLAQEQQTDAQLDQQISQAEQNLGSSKTQKQRVYWTLAVSQTEQYAIGARAAAKTTTNSMMSGSKVLDTAVTLAHSRYKRPATYIAGGLIVGLAIGVAIVIIGALTSDRLWRRDDVAEAIGAPVRLSVGSMRISRRKLKLPRQANKEKFDMRRVVAHMRHAVPGSSRGPAGLAVVAVDNAQVVAPAIVSLAASYANEGRQVVVADLSSDASVARLLGIKDAGVNAASIDGSKLLVVVPERDDVAPIGPMQSSTSLPTGSGQASETLVAASASADLMLTLVTLDPAFGGDHLATWTTDVVTMVTAGQSSATRVQAVSEMIRLAGTRLVSVVLTGADKSDESLGVPRTPDNATMQVELS